MTTTAPTAPTVPMQLIFSEVEYVSIEDLAEKIKPLTDYDPTLYIRRRLDTERVQAKIDPLIYGGARFTVTTPFKCISVDGQLYAVNGNTRRAALLMAKSLTAYKNFVFDSIPYVILDDSQFSADAVRRIQYDDNDNTDRHSLIDKALAIETRWQSLCEEFYSEISASEPDSDKARKKAETKANSKILELYRIGTLARLSQLKAIAQIPENLVTDWLEKDLIAADALLSLIKDVEAYIQAVYEEPDTVDVQEVTDKWLTWLFTFSGSKKIKPASYSKVLKPLVVLSLDSNIPLNALVKYLTDIGGLEPNEKNVKQVIAAHKIDPQSQQASAEDDEAESPVINSESSSDTKPDSSPKPEQSAIPAEFTQKSAFDRFHLLSTTINTEFVDKLPDLSDKLIQTENVEQQYLAFLGLNNLFGYITKKRLIPTTQSAKLSDMLELLASMTSDLLMDAELLENLDRDELYAFSQFTETSLRPFGVLLQALVADQAIETDQADVDNQEVSGV